MELKEMTLNDDNLISDEDIKVIDKVCEENWHAACDTLKGISEKDHTIPIAWNITQFAEARFISMQTESLILTRVGARTQEEHERYVAETFRAMLVRVFMTSYIMGKTNVELMTAQAIRDDDM